MNDIYSFFQLISKYKIEIPIIQRDYAQGRTDSKAADVRESIIEKIFQAVRDDTQPLFFDFVYGRIDYDKFVPFDGQQRLTTLFLFHKFVFEKCMTKSDCKFKSRCICNDILSRFSYLTRQSSREFCEKLVYNDVTDSDISISENVTDKSWFYSSWKKDPTIMGMLRMLNEIQNQAKTINIDYKSLAEKLTSGCNCPITFHFVDMGKQKLSDETYVKMNARGKTLTSLENFKASLEEYLEKKKDSNLHERFIGQYNEDKKCYSGIDGEWLELFWNMINEDGTADKIVPDSLIMSFINRHFMNVWQYKCDTLTKQDEKKDETPNEKIINKLKLYPSNEDFVSWEIYSSILKNCGTEECLKPLFNIWDKLYENKDEILQACQAVWNRPNSDWDPFKGKIGTDGRETYPSRIVFYALLEYFNTNEYDKESLERWMRIVWNIVENTTIDSPDRYKSALELFKNLSLGSHDIYNWLGSNQVTSNYARDQVKEEQEKAKQILVGQSENWEDTIIKAESYSFFKGAIRFLYHDSEGKVDWKQNNFDIKWNNVQKYYKENDYNNVALKDGYNNANLLKALISRFNKDNFNNILSWYYRVFNNKAETWKYYLIRKDIPNAIHDILIGNTDIKKRSPSSDFSENTIYQLSNTPLLDFVIDIIPNSWIRDYYGHKAIFPSATGVFLDAKNRDDILGTTTGIELGSDHIIRGCYLLYGSDINFKYNGNNFLWFRNEHVYLKEKDNKNDYAEKNKEGETEEDKYYCFKVESSITDKTFCEKLNNLSSEYNNTKISKE
jgi:hypothetical protein